MMPSIGLVKNGQFGDAGPVPLDAVSPSRLVELLGHRDGSVPAYRWLNTRLRLLITDGRIRQGQALPSERRLTDSLGLSRTTISRAYAELGAAGYLVARQGSGHLVQLPGGKRRIGVGGAILAGETELDGQIDLTCAASRAPAGTAEAYAAALEALPDYLGGTGYATSGLFELRETIAQRYQERGLPTDPDQILIVAGALAGVSLSLRALLPARGRVLVETPSYPNSITAARLAGARLIPTVVESSGWDVAHAVRTIRAARPALALLNPDFQNPTGALLPDPAREQLGAALTEAGTISIIDECNLEVRLDDVPMPLPFAAHQPNSILVGSSSKSHWGGFRVGWVRAPQPILARLWQAQISETLGTAVLEQLALTALLRVNPGLDSDRRAELVASRDTIAAALPNTFPGCRFRKPAGGLSLWVELPESRSRQLAQAAQGEGLLLSHGSRFALDYGLDHFLRLPYKDPAEVVSKAMDTLAQLWQRRHQLPSPDQQDRTVVA